MANPKGQAGQDASLERSSSRQVRQRAVWLASYPKSGNTWVRVPGSKMGPFGRSTGTDFLTAKAAVPARHRRGYP